MSRDGKIALGVIAALVIICLCLSVACLALGGLAIANFARADRPPVILDPDFPLDPPTPWETDEPWEEPLLPTPTPFSSQPPDPSAADTLRTLEEIIVPINDPVDLAERLKGITNVPETVPLPATPAKPGDSAPFWVTNNDTNQNNRITARLVYLNDVVSFWVEDGVDVNERDVRKLSDAFAGEIYPTNRQFFGSESTPGIDNDPRLYILYANGLGNSVAGYFSSNDSVHPKANEFSNAHEMFVISAENVRLDEDYIYSTFAHEFQHMIHHHLDRNEETWVNEGFSELAAYLNDFDPGGFEYSFISDPDMQLTTWVAIGEGNSSAHYGASYIFMNYFLGRFGEEATKALAAAPENGMDSINLVLQKLGEKDPDGNPLTAQQLFADWTIANYLRDNEAPEKIYRYPLYKYAPKAPDTEAVDNCDGTQENRTVHQYGTDYIALTCPGERELSFTGAPTVQLLPVTPVEGKYAFWSNQGDESDMTLTRTFDLTKVSGDVELSYRTWFDIEQDYDYVYLQASTDGETWKMLRTPSGTDSNPAGSNYGWGYTGDSGGWINETVDLSEYAGKSVQIRFEYVTDAAVNGRGLLLDDISLRAADYANGFEADAGGWEADGFVRVSGNLPQTFMVHLITMDGSRAEVQRLVLDANQAGTARIEVPASGKVVVVVSGTTDFTTEQAGYQFSVR